MAKAKDKAIVVKRQNFDNAMQSIRDFSEQARELEPLSRVSYSGGLFHLGDHKVTGTELNTVVSQVEDQLIDLKDFNLGFLDLITNIYKALDALDQEHISGILIAAEAAKAASDKATENVEAIQKIVKVLQKFKDKLVALEHLMDVDKAWELLKSQEQLLKTISAFQDELSALEHLKDVDELWANQASQAESMENLSKKLRAIEQSLETQGTSIASLADTVNSISENQQSFMDSTTQHLVEYKADIDQRFEGQEKAVQERIDSLHEAINQGQVSLTQKVDDVAKAQSEKLGQIMEEQAETLDHISSEQLERIAEISQSLEAEKSALNEKIATLERKAKIAYILAGGTALLATIHIFLNMIGVL